MIKTGFFSIHAKKAAGIFLLLFLPCIAPGLYAQSPTDVKTVVSSGYSRIYGDAGDAKNAALAEGIRFAVQKTASEIFSEDQMKKEYEAISQVLYSNPNRFIQNYGILQEFRMDRSYFVLVRSTVMADQIKEALTGAGIQIRPEELPSVLIMVAERHIDDIHFQYWWRRGQSLSGTETAAAPITGVLAKKGFTVIDPERALVNLNAHTRGLSLTATPANYEAAIFGRRMGAHMVVLGTAEATRGDNRMGENIRTYKGNADLRVVDTQSGRVLTRAKHEITSPGEDSAIAANAMADAAFQATRQLIPRIEALWKQEAIPSGGIILVLSGEDILPNLEQFRETMEGLPDVSSLRTARLSPERATLWVDFRGTSDELADRLLRESYEPFGIHIREVFSDELQIEVERRTQAEILTE